MDYEEGFLFHSHTRSDLQLLA